MRIRPIALALAFMLGAAGAHAQDTTLDRVQNLINTGRLTDARNALAQWERAKGDPTSDATSADRARALYLTGILSTDPALAEDAFLNVVLSYPSSAVAPDALLRLGQALYTAGENDRAISYLSRLQSDYPPSTVRETGILWLTRAQLAGGAASDACGTARDNLAGTTNPNLRLLIEIERDRACQASGGIATRNAQPTGETGAARASTDLPAPGSASEGTRPAPRDAVSPTSVPVDAPRATPITAGQTRAAQPAAPDDARPAPINTQRPGTDDARRPTSASAQQPASAPKLPDLGIAVDDNVREPEPETRPNAAVPRPANPSAQPSAPQQTAASPSTAQQAATEPAPAAAPVTDNMTRAAADTNTGEYAVQTAAFSQRQAADRIAAELRDKGFDARIVIVPGSALFRVRYGVFTDRREAAAAALHVRDAGFATLIVNDVRLERRP